MKNTVCLSMQKKRKSTHLLHHSRNVVGEHCPRQAAARSSRRWAGPRAGRTWTEADGLRASADAAHPGVRHGDRDGAGSCAADTVADRVGDSRGAADTGTGGSPAAGGRGSLGGAVWAVGAPTEGCLETHKTKMGTCVCIKKYGD